MLLHLIKNKLKVLIRSKELIFWTLIFPILLGTFFKLALSGISSSEEFEPVKIAVVENEKYKQEENLEKILKSLSQEGDNQVFDTVYVQDIESADKLLVDSKISGFIEMNQNGEVNINVKNNGIEQTIIKYVIDEYYQMTSVATHAIEFNPQIIYDGTLNLLEESKNYLNNKSNDNIDYCMNYYYTLIAMACIYGGFFGIEAVKETEANLSKRAARVAVSPVHKLKMLFANITAGFIIQYIEILVLLVYVIFVLGANFGSNVLWILILSLFGCFAGTCFGVLLGVTNKKDENMKIGILISTTMACCFFAGMMGVPQIKYMMEQSVPIIKYNPVTLITDGLYSLYSYTTLNMYFEKLISIIILSIIMIAISYIFVRRKKYDSI